MSEPVTLRTWTDVIRRARLGRTVKAVALLLATYADADGTRIWPGVARLSYAAEVSYNTAKAALRTLREVGLIEKVGRRGEADVYRLTIAPDLLQRCHVPTPAQVDAELVKVRRLKRGTYVPKTDQQPGKPGTLRPEPCTAEIDEDDALRPESRAAEPAVCGPNHDTIPEPAARSTTILRPVERAATNQDRDTTTTHHPDQDPIAAVTGSRASHPEPPRATPSHPAPADADVIDLAARLAEREAEAIAAAAAKLGPTKCEHGLTLAGGCAICRRLARTSP